MADVFQWLGNHMEFYKACNKGLLQFPAFPFLKACNYNLLVLRWENAEIFFYYLSYFQKMMILSGIVLKNVGRWETKNPFPKVMSRNKCERNTKAQYTCTTEAPGKLNKRNL